MNTRSNNDDDDDKSNDNDTDDNDNTATTTATTTTNDDDDDDHSNHRSHNETIETWRRGRAYRQTCVIDLWPFRVREGFVNAARERFVVHVYIYIYMYI